MSGGGICPRAGTRRSYKAEVSLTDGFLAQRVLRSRVRG